MASYANPAKMVVLIDEDKIERMATDEAYRKKYEAIISGVTNQLAQVKTSISSTGADVLGFGMQVNDSGLPSFFAVLKTSSAAQKARIEKKAEEAKEERLEEKRTERKRVMDRDGDTVTIEADSIEELAKKIADFMFVERANTLLTQAETKLGQHIDFQA